ncbi:MAG: BON domain-containing protein [Methylobacter sp.]|nr:BON domain-containing protein [Methylobacter sp.]
MSRRLLLAMFTLTGSLIMMTSNAQAEQGAAIFLAADSPAENTERNVRDKYDTTLTPEDQIETESDVNVTANIRKAVVADESLSVNAKNIKIITRKGVVTLRGPVESQAESMKLQQIATQTPGAVRVDNQLEIKAP